MTWIKKKQIQHSDGLITITKPFVKITHCNLYFCFIKLTIDNFWIKQWKYIFILIIDIFVAHHKFLNTRFMMKRWKMKLRKILFKLIVIYLSIKLKIVIKLIFKKVSKFRMYIMIKMKITLNKTSIIFSSK